MKTLQITSSVPKWLERMANCYFEFNKPIPLAQMLKDSVFWGCSGPAPTYKSSTQSPLFYNPYIGYSYITVDLLEMYYDHILRCQEGFRNYKFLKGRMVSLDELVPPGWSPPITPTKEDLELTRLRLLEKDCTQYTYLSIYELISNPDFSHYEGVTLPKYISLLYCSGEMAAVYQALYNRLGIVPRILVLYYPGMASSDYILDQNNQLKVKYGFFQKVLEANPVGLPKYFVGDRMITNLDVSVFKGIYECGMKINRQVY